MVVSPSLHLGNQFFMAVAEQGGVYKSFLDKSLDVFPIIQAARQHMQFYVLAQKVLAAHLTGVYHPHSHEFNIT